MARYTAYELPKKPMVSKADILRAPRNWRENREGMDHGHVAMIKQLPCSVCPSRRDIDGHHLKSLEAARFRGVFLRAPDRFALPLCRWLHHSEIEAIGSRREVAWFAEYGIDPHALAAALWDARGDLDRMRRVLQAHKGGR